MPGGEKVSRCPDLSSRDFFRILTYLDLQSSSATKWKCSFLQGDRGDGRFSVTSALLVGPLWHTWAPPGLQDGGITRETSLCLQSGAAFA